VSEPLRPPEDDIAAVIPQSGPAPHEPAGQATHTTHTRTVLVPQEARLFVLLRDKETGADLGRIELDAARKIDHVDFSSEEKDRVRRLIKDAPEYP